MDRENKNRSGSQSDHGSADQRANRNQVVQPGAPPRHNRPPMNHERDHSNGRARRNTSKKGPDSY